MCCLTTAAETVRVTHFYEIQEYGYLYCSPRPDAEYVAPETIILVRFAELNPNDLLNPDTFIQVEGEQSGSHTGQARWSTDGRTFRFEPDMPFTRNERVTVRFLPFCSQDLSAPPIRMEYDFYVSRPVDEPQSQAAMVSPNTIETPEKSLTATLSQPLKSSQGQVITYPNGVSVPGDFPQVDITVNNNPAPGYIFIDYNNDVTKYAMIMDNSGAPVWYKRGSTARDFKVQKNGIITWANFSGYDQNFNYLHSFRAVNGYSTDNHELQVLENGHYLLFGRRTEAVDMRRYVPDGKPDAKVHETVLQEFTPECDMIFQWRAWDNYDIRLMQYWSYDDKPTSSSIRFVHMNAVDVDTDGHLLISSKRVSEVTKINRDTGEVIWRLGSGHPTNPDEDPYLDQRLTILDDPLGQFNVQHDIRVTGENRYTVFDNHHLDRNPNSRAVEYLVDPITKTAQMVWQYYGGYDSYHMGNAQRLPNGNTLINWVITNAPKVTEVKPDGTKAFEMNWTSRDSKSYRVFRFPWNGLVEAPYLVIEPQPDNLTLIFNKFGDTNVAYYRIYGGTSPNPATIFGISTTTFRRLTNLQDGVRYYFRVTAVDFNGIESDYSNEESAIGVSSVAEPGRNMVINGDFSQGKYAWGLNGLSDAQWNIEDGVCHFDINSQSTEIQDIQLWQPGMKLVQGIEYVLEFDAWANPPGIIEVIVEKDGSPWIDYSMMGYSYITGRQRHFIHTFTMENISDFEAYLVFNIGGTNFDLYLDNVSLMVLPSTNVGYEYGAGFNNFTVLQYARPFVKELKLAKLFRP